MAVMEAHAIDVFTVRLSAPVRVEGDAAGDLMDAVLSALERDPRAHAPVCGYDYATGELDAIFQVQDDAGVGLDQELAASGAARIFDAALISAGIAVLGTMKLAIVEGDDPDLLTEHLAVSAENWTHGPSTGWTDEQAANAATYGVCMVCGAPRESKLNGRPMIDEDVSLEIVCPNGHAQ
jgi:hypothetical protein